MFSPRVLVIALIVIMKPPSILDDQVKILTFQNRRNFTITPHVCDVSGVIVLTSSVCLSVCLLPLSWPNGQTYILEFRNVGQVEGYLGQVWV